MRQASRRFAGGDRTKGAGPVAPPLAFGAPAKAPLAAP
jgi:hypothetical protein